MVDGSWSMETERKKIERVEDMPVFQLFYRLAIEIEKATRSFGRDFRWLRGQVLRASESVCSNMTEGFYSQYSTEYLQALYRCRREAREILLHLRYARDTGNLSDAVLSQFEDKSEDGLQQLTGLLASIERKIADRGKAKPGAIILKEEGGNYVSFHEP
jgi:four helix bundle protein